MSNFDLPGWRGNLFTTDHFFLINILKICHNIKKFSKTHNILSLTDLYPPLILLIQKLEGVVLSKETLSLITLFPFQNTPPFQPPTIPQMLFDSMQYLAREYFILYSEAVPLYLLHLLLS